MKLEKLKLIGFKCFKELIEIPIHDLTVFIGENDCGKSSLFKAIECLLSKITPLNEEFCSLPGHNASEIIIEGIFTFQSEIPDELKAFTVDSKLYLRKEFRKDEIFKTKIWYDKLQDDDLINYDSLAAPQMQSLLEKYRLPVQSNQTLRKEFIKEFIEENMDVLPKVRNYYEVNFNKFVQYLPLFEYYSSSDYGNPKALIFKTLNTIYRSQFYKDDGQLKTKNYLGLKEKIENKLNSQIKNNLLDKIKKYNSNVISVKGEFSIDFSRGLSLDDLAVDEGHGFKLIGHKGEGSKKRLFLSILEWDKEVQNLIGGQSLIRGYDEPDTNLHFEAQRKMFYAIKESSENLNSHIQNIIATHSISMIDRAPTKSINHIKNAQGASKIEFLKTDDDVEVKRFLEEICEISGIKNSSIFYEKCFLIVEGDSEENSIPKLYKTYFKRSLMEDGIVLVNLQSNGSWKSFLKVLNQNKQSITILLLDKDTQNPECGAKITQDKLIEIGFSPEFLNTNVIFAGIQEFEDLYPDNLIRNLFNSLYPRSTIGKWTLSHIRKLRTDYHKISKGFEVYSKQYISTHHKRYNKPEFASKMSDLLTYKNIQNIPTLVTLFNKIQQIINT